MRGTDMTSGSPARLILRFALPIMAGNVCQQLYTIVDAAFVGRFAEQEKFPAFTYRSRVPFFSWMGRHALIVYVVHQPIIYAIMTLIQLF